MDFHAVVYDVALILGAAIMGAMISSMLRISSVVGFVIAGVLVGPSGLALLDSLPGANIIAECGAILLLFTIGLELSFNSLKMHKRLLLTCGLTQVVTTMGIVVGIVYFFFEMDLPQSLLWGCLISLSSTAIVMKLLVDARDSTSTHGKAVTGILLTQDIAVIPMTLAVPLLADSHGLISQVDLAGLGDWLVKFFFVIAGVFVGAKWVVPRFLEVAAAARSRELFFFAIVLLCLVFALIFETLNLSLALGAFLSGLLISESPFGRKATADILLVRDIFLALFFCSVGMLLDIDYVLENLGLVAGLATGVIVLKFATAVLAARAAKIPLKSALVTGAMVFQVGEFSFVLAELGRDSGLISGDGFQVFLAITVFSMVLTPFSFKFAPRLLLPQRSTGGEGKSPSELGVDAVIVGFGPAGQEVAARFRRAGVSYRVIEHNYSLVKKSTGEPIVYGDGADDEILHTVGIAAARLVVICVPGLEPTKAVLRAVLNHNPDIRALVRTTYSAEAQVLGHIVGQDAVVDSESLSTEVLAAKAMALLGTELEPAG